MRWGIALLLTISFFASRSFAADFYRGRTIDLYIGFGVGGSYDLYSRAIAQYLGHHIPGEPTILPRNMPGAGGLTAANFMASVAPKDGTALAMTAQTVGLDQMFGVSGVAYNVLDFVWIGRAAAETSAFFTWYTSPTKRFADAASHETTMGSSGSGDTTDVPRALNALAGAKFKLVLGYRGSNDVALAVERGEIEGGYGLWSDMKVRKADWLSEHLINVLFLVGDRPDADHPDLPLATSLAPTKEGRAIIGLFSAPSFIGRSIFTTEGVPADRVAILRQAFAETLDDPHFRADAQRMGLEIEPMTGLELQEKVRALMQTPKDLVAKADKARQP